jgi:hypothetical protein
MFLCRSEATAKGIAQEHALSYGWSVFHSSVKGGWYVGTPDELIAIGVLDPVTPSTMPVAAPVYS